MVWSYRIVAGDKSRYVRCVDSAGEIIVSRLRGRLYECGPDDARAAGTIHLEDDRAFRLAFELDVYFPKIFLEDVLPDSLNLFRLYWDMGVHARLRYLIWEAAKAYEGLQENGILPDAPGDLRVRVELSLTFGETSIPLRLNTVFCGVFISSCLWASLSTFETDWWRQVHIPLRVLVRTHRANCRERYGHDPLSPAHAPDRDETVWTRPVRNHLDAHPGWREAEARMLDPPPPVLPW